LRDPNNKQELFAFPSKKVAAMKCPSKKEIVIIYGSTAIVRGSSRSMSPCNHEEADTRLI